MAEPPAPPSGGSEEKFGFLVRKIGPLPVWAWGVIAVGVYYWYTHYGPGARSATPSASAASGNGSGDNVTETLNTTTGPATVSESSQVTDTSPGAPKPVAPKPGPVRTVRPANHTPPQASEPRTITVAKYPGKSVNGRAQWDTTLWGIAQHEHVTLTALEKANPQVKNPDMVYPGEKIRIP